MTEKVSGLPASTVAFSSHSTNDLSANKADPDKWKQIRDHLIFHGIADDELNKIIPFFRTVSLKPGQLLIQEGVQESSDLFLVLQGNLEVNKKDYDAADQTMFEENPLQFTIARLTAGDIIGEFSFITGDSRSATIKSITRSELLSITASDFEKLEHLFPSSSIGMMKNITRYIAGRVRQTSSDVVRTLKVKLENSILNSRGNLFFSYVIGLLCVYNLVIHIIITLSMDANTASQISAMIIIIFAGVLVLMVRQSKLPFKIIGLTTKNWKLAVTESLGWTLVVIAVLIVAKWMLIQYVPRYNNLPLFDFDFMQRKYMAFNFILYGLHSPIQEFISRGVLQGSLQHYFKGKNVTLRAIIVSNALFSATHVHLMNGMLGVIVFIPGLFWGWLYARHGNLIGVSISHLLIGWTALFFLNFESLF